MREDEKYILKICDKVLKCESKRQHRFDFLRGDPSPKRKNGTRLPVDAYYESYNLVIEYHERQHTEAVIIFDNKMTCSGVLRDEQRRLYDQRRRDTLPKHRIKLVTFSFSDFDHFANKRLVHSELKDEIVIRKKLEPFLKE